MKSNSLYKIIFYIPIISYAIFMPAESFVDHLFDFHLDPESIKPPEKGVHENDWLIEAEHDYVDNWKSDRDRSSSAGDNGGRDFSPDRDK
jgi:hypothetical protein